MVNTGYSETQKTNEREQTQNNGNKKFINSNGQNFFVNPKVPQNIRVVSEMTPPPQDFNTHS
jgi:hypothetical protein